MSPLVDGVVLNCIAFFIENANESHLKTNVNPLAFALLNLILGSSQKRAKNPTIKIIKGGRTMARRVVIDADECIGCESCVELCAEVFAFNEDEEKAEVILPEGGPEDCIEEAMETCPTECITWEDAD